MAVAVSATLMTPQQRRVSELFARECGAELHGLGWAWANSVITTQKFVGKLGHPTAMWCMQCPVSGWKQEGGFCPEPSPEDQEMMFVEKNRGVRKRGVLVSDQEIAGIWRSLQQRTIAAAQHAGMDDITERELVESEFFYALRDPSYASSGAKAYQERELIPAEVAKKLELAILVAPFGPVPPLTLNGHDQRMNLSPIGSLLHAAPSLKAVDVLEAKND